MQDVFQNVQEGADSLLLEAVNVMLDFPSTKYMIIGGWCPYLRNPTPIKHPGTLDVDLFFEGSCESGSLKQVVVALMDRGYMPSAKHEFQLLKKIKIKNFQFVYNIDLLHPMMLPEKRGQIFIEQLDLDVPYDSEEYRLKKIVSIVVPNSKILFDEQLYDDSTIFKGNKINLMTFDGLLLTKMDSFKQIKRPRDSFDIFLGFKGNKINVEKIKYYSLNNERIKKSLNGFLDEIRLNGEKFNDNISKYCDVFIGDPAKEILDKFK